MNYSIYNKKLRTVNTGEWVLGTVFVTRIYSWSNHFLIHKNLFQIIKRMLLTHILNYKYTCSLRTRVFVTGDIFPRTYWNVRLLHNIIIKYATLFVDFFINKLLLWTIHETIQQKRPQIKHVNGNRDTRLN